MVEITIPGRGLYRLEHLVCDVNGTLAVDGRLIDGVRNALEAVQQHLRLHLLTADTHGRQHEIDRELGLTAARITGGDEPGKKAEYVRALGSHSVVAVGQGSNDAAMLEEAAIGICVSSAEGTAVETLLSADILAPTIMDAFDLVLNPRRLVATLRR